MNYFFVPGRKWLLSLAEIRSVLEQKRIHFVELSSNEHVILFDIMEKIPVVTDLFMRLGGAVKCGYVIDDVYEFLSQSYEDETEHDKVRYAISFYGDNSYRRTIADERNALGMQIKKWLRERKIPARFVSKFSSLETSAVLLKTNHVLEEGFEINRISHPKTGKTVWGITLAVQDYEGFAKRDYSRPRVNKKKGMLPPKLARIMLNLANIPEGGTVWDPFCGSGTIAMEALLLGYSVVASDIDPLSIEETNENVRWICEQYWISHGRYKVVKHDIRDSLDVDISFDAVVSEPYLGPVLRRKISVEEVNNVQKEIKPLFNALGMEIDRQIQRKRHGSIVMVVPGFRSYTGWLDMNETFEQHPSIQKSPLPRFPESERLQWDRPNSIIRRNILKFYY